MPTIAQIANVLESAAPLSLAAAWDNVGLQLGVPAALANRVLLTVDVTDQVVEQAMSRGVELIIAHHPLIFHPLRQVVKGDAVGERVITLIRQNIALYVAHTNLDCAPRLGTAESLAAALGLVDATPLVLGEEGTMPPPVALSGKGGVEAPPAPSEVAGLGRTGRLPETSTLQELALRTTAALGMGQVRMYGDPRQPVAMVAVAPGHGGSAIRPAALHGASALVTGELDHHEILDALDQCLTVITVGHLASERPVRESVARLLQGRWPDLVTIIAEERALGVTVNANEKSGRLS